MNSSVESKNHSRWIYSLRSVFIAVVAIAFSFLAMHQYLKRFHVRAESLRALIELGATPMEQERFDVEIVFGISASEDRGILDAIRASRQASKVRVLFFGAITATGEDAIDRLVTCVRELPNISTIHFSEGVLSEDELVQIRLRLPKLEIEIADSTGDLGGSAFDQ